MVGPSTLLVRGLEQGKAMPGMAGMYLAVFHLAAQKLGAQVVKGGLTGVTVHMARIGRVGQ